MQKELTTKKDYAAVGEEISHKMAGDFMKAYQDAYPTENRGYLIGRNIIELILAQPGCVGMRFYYGLNEDNQKTLVYVGIDSQGNDLIKRTIVMENGALTVADGIMGDRSNWTGGFGK